MSAHALLAPSSAPQWGHCSGSVKANMHVLDIETQESRNGTAAHWVALDCCLRNGIADANELLGKVDPDGTIIDEKMVEGAQAMVDDVCAVHAEHGGRLLLEHRVAMPHIHQENWGTLDCALPLLDKGIIYLWDYKHGHGIVDAKDNLQLIDYLAGLMQELNIDGYAEQYITVIFRIVQPFAYRSQGPVNEWRVKISDLRAQFNQLTYKAAEALGPNPTMTTGKHCQHCKAVGRCGSAKAAGYNYVDLVNAPYQIDTMDGASLATERQILEDGMVLAKARLKAIEDDLKYRIKNGDASTGLTLETGYGNLKWSVADAQAIALAKQFGADISKTVAMTPTQAIKAVSKECRDFFKDALKAIAKREAKGTTLINAEDSISHRAFKKVN